MVARQGPKKTQPIAERHGKGPWPPRDRPDAGSPKQARESMDARVKIAANQTVHVVCPPADSRPMKILSSHAQLGMPAGRSAFGSRSSHRFSPSRVPAPRWRSERPKVGQPPLAPRATSRNFRLTSGIASGATPRKRPRSPMRLVFAIIFGW